MLRISDIDDIEKRVRAYRYQKELLEQYVVLHSADLFYTGYKSSNVVSMSPMIGRLRVVLVALQLAECYRVLNELEDVVDVTEERAACLAIADGAVPETEGEG